MCHHSVDSVPWLSVCSYTYYFISYIFYHSFACCFLHISIPDLCSV